MALARLRLEQGRASEAAGLAEKSEGRPVLVEARAALARALEWIRGSLKAEHVDAFMARRDVQAFLGDFLSRLDEAGRGAEAASLRGFLAVPAKRAGA